MSEQEDIIDYDELGIQRFRISDENIRMIKEYIDSNNGWNGPNPYKLISISRLYNDRYLVLIETEHYVNTKHVQMKIRPYVLFRADGFTFKKMETEHTFGRWMFEQDEQGNEKQIYLGK